MQLRPVNADGDLSAGGAELLEEAPVGPDPQVVLRDLHLGMNSNCLQHQCQNALMPTPEQVQHHRQTGSRVGQGLDLMTLRVFSNLTNSVIL